MVKAELSGEYRKVWIDIIRIIMTWGVISIHGKYCYDYIPMSVPWFQYIFIGNMATCCVPVFLMLSGCLVLENECNVDKSLLRRLFRVFKMLIMQYFICIIAAFFVHVWKEKSLSGVFEAINGWESYAFGRSFYWIFLGCYISSPFLRAIVSDKKLENYFLFVGGIFGLIVPCFVDLQYVGVPSAINRLFYNLDCAEVLVPLGASYLFVLGHWLNRIAYLFSKKASIIFFLLSLGIWEFVGAYCTYISEAEIKEGNFLILALRYGRYYGTYVSPIIILYSASVFLVIKRLFGQSSLNNAVSYAISYVARKCTYIFMFHGIVIRFFRARIPHFFVGTPLLSVCIDSTIYFIIAFILSVIIEMLLQRGKAVAVRGINRSKVREQ